MKQLDLVLKYKWFDMIESGAKPEEYRDIKPFWIRRLLTPSLDMEGDVFEEFCHDLMNPVRYESTDEVLAYFDCRFIKFDTIRFRRGYQKGAKTMIWTVNACRIDNAKPEWAEGYMGRVFVLPLIEKIS